MTAVVVLWPSTPVVQVPLPGETVILGAFGGAWTRGGAGYSIAPLPPRVVPPPPGVGVHTLGHTGVQGRCPRPYTCNLFPASMTVQEMCGGPTCTRAVGEGLAKYHDVLGVQGQEGGVAVPEVRGQ